MITNLFNYLLYYPLLNILVWLYNNVAFHDLGVAIVILTVLIRLVLYPLSQKGIKSQQALSALQPKIKEIQEKFKGNKEEQGKQLMALYSQNGVNPMAGCLPMLVQLPILIALYRVFLMGIKVQDITGLYSFIQKPEALNVISLGFLNLSQRNIVLAVVAGFLQFIQSKMMLGKMASNTSGNKKSDDFTAIMNKQMTYFMPVMTVMIAWNLPAALPLYWIVITLFAIIQQYLAQRSAPVKA